MRQQATRRHGACRRRVRPDARGSVARGAGQVLALDGIVEMRESLQRLLWPFIERVGCAEELDERIVRPRVGDDVRDAHAQHGQALSRADDNRCERPLAPNRVVRIANSVHKLARRRLRQSRHVSPHSLLIRVEERSLQRRVQLLL
eukprot:4392916-Prymnesium_polylepis.2